MKRISGHELKIKSLHDTMATCECGDWSYSLTGFSNGDRVREEHEKHLANVRRAEGRE